MVVGISPSGALGMAQGHRHVDLSLNLPDGLLCSPTGHALQLTLGPTANVGMTPTNLANDLRLALRAALRRSSRSCTSAVIFFGSSTDVAKCKRSGISLFLRNYSRRQYKYIPVALSQFNSSWRLGVVKHFLVHDITESFIMAPEQSK